ncbi:MAG: membrane protein insertase YidC [Muribaculaceae bacterium]|nr:membrane protein insertase YidC [Muribaculaceae bacterium]
MDKNTLTGILLMGAIIFGFMYLNKPSAEELEKQRLEQADRIADEQRRQAEAEREALTIPDITDADLSALCNGMALYGRRQADGSRTFSTEAYKLRLVNDSTLTGEIVTPAGEISVTDVINRNFPDGMDARQKADASRSLLDAKTQLARYKSFAGHLSGNNTIVGLENDVISLQLSTHGAQISNVVLKDYKCYIQPDTTLIQLWNSEQNNYSFTLRSDSEKFESASFFFEPVVESDSSVLMKLDLGSDAWWGIRYSLPEADGYVVKMDVVQHNMAAAGVIPAGVSTMEFNWHQTMQRFERGRVFEERNSAIYYKEEGEKPDDLSAQGNADKEIKAPVKWIGFKNQFFSSILIPDGTFNAGTKLKSVELTDNLTALKDMTATTQVNYSVSRDSVAGFNWYLGPNLYPVLRDMDRISPNEDLQLTRVIPLGWSLFRWINTGVIIPLFSFLSKYIVNYGIIILVLTLFIKLVLFPFTFKTFKSQAKMRVLAPEIKEINDRYPGQDQAMTRQQKTMELYSKAGANPMGGCLPMLLQMPILIAMFSFFPSCIELRGQSFLWAHDLAAPDAIITWKANIPVISWIFGNHLSLFCLLMTVTNIIYSKITMASQPGSQSMPGMKLMTYGMPLMFLFWFNNYAAGLSYYYFLSLLITILQTYAIRHWVIDEDKVRAEMAANAKKPRKKSGFMARLEEAQRQQQAMLREQQKQQAKKRR